MLVLLWAGGSLFMFFRFPLIANPLFVMEKLEQNQLDPVTLVLLSGMSPIFVTAMGFLLLMLILFFADRMLTEKRLLQIIDTLKENR